MITLKLTPNSGDAITLVIGKMANDYVIKSSHQPFYFKASSYQVQALLDANVDTLSELQASVSSDVENTGDDQQAE